MLWQPGLLFGMVVNLCLCVWPGATREDVHAAKWQKLRISKGAAPSTLPALPGAKAAPGGGKAIGGQGSTTDGGGMGENDDEVMRKICAIPKVKKVSPSQEQAAAEIQSLQSLPPSPPPSPST